MSILFSCDLCDGCVVHSVDGYSSYGICEKCGEVYMTTCEAIEYDRNKKADEIEKSLRLDTVSVAMDVFNELSYGRRGR